MMQLNEQAIQRIVRFSQLCIQSKHPFNGKPLQLLPWQMEFIRNVYGRIEAGERLYNKAGLWIPKKNGKSSFLSMLCLYHLLEYEGSEVYCIASNIEQAGLIFNESCKMIQLGKLSQGKRFKLRPDIKRIEDTKGHSIFKILSSDREGKAGINANFIAKDEVAEWGAHAREILAQLQYASAARKNALHITLSTAQFQLQHPGYEEYSYAKRVKEDPTLDERFYPCIYECPNITGKEWHNPKEWLACNPSANITFPERDLQDAYKGVVNDPKNEFTFRTLRLNQWVAGGHNKWIASHLWTKGKCKFNEADLYGREAYLGLDFSRKHDLCCYVVCVPVDDKVYLLPRAFKPEALAEDAERIDKFPYRFLASKPENHLYLTPGNVVDTRLLRAEIAEDAKRFQIREVGYDPHGAETDRQILEFEYGLTCVAVTQTKMVMSPAIGYMERMIIDDKLRHNNPVLDWCIYNASVKPVGDDAILLVKSEESQRIDLAVASAIGLSRYMVDESRYLVPQFYSV